MKKLKNFQNPLAARGKRVNEGDEPQEEIRKANESLKMIYKFGDFTTINEGLVNRIDYNDRMFINRLYDDLDELFNDDMTDLKESIKAIGLMNNVYLLEKDPTKDGKRFIIVSGLRRLLAVDALLKEGNNLREINKVIVFRKDTPMDFLNRVSIDENTKRKDLTILELSYKLRKDSKENNKSIEDLMKEHNLNRRKYFRITKALNYPKDLKTVLEEVGVNKAETINKIIKVSKEKDIKKIVEQCVDLTERELTDLYKKLSKKKREKFSYLANGKNSEITIKIKHGLSDEVEKLIKEFEDKLKNLIDLGN